MNWSKYQSDIFDWVKNGTGNAIIKGVAGCGKTTTLIEALNHIPKGLKVLMVAFNKSIASEIQARICRKDIEVSTIHSYGFKLLRRQIGGCKINSYKVLDTLDDVYNFKELIHRPGVDKNQIREIKDGIRDTIRLGRLNRINFDDRGQIADIMDRYGIDAVNGHIEQIPEAVHVLRMKCESGDIDFDDMVCFPVESNMQSQEYDFVLIDELQDVNKAQAELILSSVKPSGRVLGVGDILQSIYGFSGADTDSIPRIQKMLNAKDLPLSITYRCPKLVVDMAKKFNPDIKVADHAIDGKIRTITEEQFVKELTEDDFVLCRINAPLVSLAFELIAKEQKACIVGRDIGKQLANMATRVIKAYEKSVPDASIDDFEEQLYIAKTNELEKLKRRRASETSMQTLVDKIEAISIVAAGCKELGEIPLRIESLFSNEKKGITLSSVHRAKGLEADRVYIIAPDRMPLPRVKQDWEIQQEKNIQYVAYTRAKKELVFVETQDEK